MSKRRDGVKSRQDDLEVYLVEILVFNEKQCSSKMHLSLEI